MGAGVLALALANALLSSGASSRALAQSGSVTEPPVPQTDASVPANGVTMIGATPLEAPGKDETWGVGKAGGTTVLVRYTKEGGWSLGPALPARFAFDESPLAGQMTPRGAGAMVGEVPTEAGGKQEVVLVRNPGGAFEETASVPAEGATLAKGEEPLLKEEEELFGKERAPLVAPLDEADGSAGALLVPVNKEKHPEAEHQVLDWDGHEWTSEPIAIPAASSGDFRVLAIAASGPTNAWLLAQLSSKSSYPTAAVALFHRVEEGEGESARWTWKSVGGTTEGEAQPLTVPVKHTGSEPESEPFTVHGIGEPPKVVTQVLTVTSEGVWIDGQRRDVQTLEPATTTLFFKPEGAMGGRVQSSWCLLPPGVPEGTPECEHELPEALPSGPSRSIAWANGTPFGERVITGLPEGVSLSLQGESFERVLALGAGIGPGGDPGAAYGAAFTDPHEGWLGEDAMPVHLTREPLPTHLTPWPVTFRHPLLAIAPQPGAPVGALSSEALAVGEKGAVARFKPGQGWVPESLFGSGEVPKYPRLRAVAWPTQNRAYAVGDGGAMWLWRAETGLWEPDPATPVNFRANMLGIAFDPGEPTQGYAVGSAAVVGEGGTLLRYGKTWTPETALPEEVKHADFISIAFAGSEAIVAYREPASEGKAGGLLVNNGSGWRIEEQAASVLDGGVPATVAGLPDGGAAFSTSGGAQGPRVYERESAGAPWEPTPAPLPGLQPGSLTIFREGGALRALVASGTLAQPSEGEATPPESPPSILEPISPIGGGPQSGGLLRQTVTGWQDEEHELNPAGEPRGGYADHDLPYRPDPVLATLIAPDGSQGWAIGGNLESSTNLQTGDVERYQVAPSEASAPLGAATSKVALEPENEYATFAVGGNAQCAAPCADRALAGVGPDVWLTAALARARQIGVRAFLYTGPYVTQAKVNGERSVPVPFAAELERYASIIASGLPLEVWPAAAAPELDARPERQGSVADFERAFAGLPEPFNEGNGLPSGERSTCAHTIGCEAAYYARNSEGLAGTVRVIVLDDTADVDEAQLKWLEAELEGAKASKVPAIVVGNADLNAQIAAGDVAAQKVAAALVGGSAKCQYSHGPHEPCGASAYFYDSPEENVTKPLRAQSPEGLSEEIPTFGSGTLGYINVTKETSEEFNGASGFLLGQIGLAAYNKELGDAGATHAKTNNRAAVTVRLIPNISELALEARNGVVLRRSNAALFEGLARRPRAGGLATENSEQSVVDPYIPIPENCVGATCATGLFPEYTFSSSRPDIGEFVKPNLEVEGGSKVPELGTNGEPIPDPQSGLFCALNPGTTIVSIEAGGLKALLPVTVQAGSVRQPCGTVPFTELPPVAQTVSAVPPPAPAPAASPAATPAAAPPVPLPPPPPPPVPPPPRPPAPSPPPFFTPPLVSLAPAAFVPPPPVPEANPTPPSGTSAVTSPVEAAQREEEEEEAPESVSNQASAYRTPEPSPLYVLGIVTLAAFAGASIRRRPRRDRRGTQIAQATTSSEQAQRQARMHRHTGR